LFLHICGVGKNFTELTSISSSFAFRPCTC